MWRHLKAVIGWSCWIHPSLCSHCWSSTPRHTHYINLSHVADRCCNCFLLPLLCNMILLTMFTQWGLDVGHWENGWGRQSLRCYIISSSSHMCLAVWVESVGHTETRWHHYQGDYERLARFMCYNRKSTQLTGIQFSCQLLGGTYQLLWYASQLLIN